MRERFARLFAVVVFVCGLLPFVALAQEVPITGPLLLDEPGPRLEVRAAERPIAIGRFNILIGAEAGWLHNPPAQNDFIAVLPFRVGITQDFEIFAGPVVTTAEPHVSDPALGVLYQFLHGDFELAARAAGNFAFFDGPIRHAGAAIGVPMRYHVARELSIDFGAHFLFLVDLNAMPMTQNVAYGMLLPVGATVSITRSFFASLQTGLIIPDFEHAGDTIGAPLEVTVGYTIPDDIQPLVDLGARINWGNLRFGESFSVLGFARFYIFA